jgi:hypothetical protein
MTKATHKKTTVDVIKQQKKNAKRQAGMGRQQASGVSAASAGTQTLVQSSQSSSAGNNSSGALLTAGGTMMGPIAFYPKAIMISSDTIDISSTTDTGFSSRVSITGQTTADDLKQIDGANNAGQILFLQSITGQTITLKHHTGSAGGGNINIPGGADYVMGAQDIVLLQWDTIHHAYSNSGGQWTLVSSGNSSSSGATRELDNLQNTAVNADIIPASASSVDLGSLAKPYDKTYSDEVVFVTEGPISTNKPTIGWGNSTRGMTFSMHNLGSTQNAWTWEENGTTKMTLSNGGMLSVGTVVSTTLLRAEGDTDVGNATTDTFTITARVDSDIIPTATQSHDLGDTDRWWDKLYSMYVYTNRVSLSGTNAQIDMNNYPIMECGDIDFNDDEHIKRSGVNFIEFQATKILIEKPVQIDEDLTMASAYFNPGNVTTGAASGTAKFFYVKVPDSGASGWAYAKVPCYT